MVLIVYPDMEAILDFRYISDKMYIECVEDYQWNIQV